MKRKTGLLSLVLAGIFLAPLYSFRQIRQPLRIGSPDLAIELSCSSRGLALSQVSDRVGITVSNLGAVMASNFRVVLILSSSRIDPSKITNFSRLDPGVIELFSKRVDSLGPNARISLQADALGALPAHVQTGEYNLLGVVDPTNSIQESDEKNNLAVCSILIPAKITAVQSTMTSESMGGMLFQSVKILGQRFGLQADKLVKYDGHDLGINPGTWQNTQMIGNIHPDIEPGELQFHIERNGIRISNTASYLLKAWINKTMPGSGVPGTEISIVGRNFGSSQGAKKVKFGAAEASILTWQPQKIRATVPSLPPGTYPVKIEKNGVELGSGGDFTVLSSFKPAGGG